jgi:hypothetical protein
MTFMEDRIFINVAGKIKTPHKWQYLPVLKQGAVFMIWSLNLLNASHGM